MIISRTANQVSAQHNVYPIARKCWKFRSYNVHLRRLRRLYFIALALLGIHKRYSPAREILEGRIDRLTFSALPKLNSQGAYWLKIRWVVSWFFRFVCQMLISWNGGSLFRDKLRDCRRVHRAKNDDVCSSGCALDFNARVGLISGVCVFWRQWFRAGL
jgi:hypothetical protein